MAESTWDLDEGIDWAGNCVLQSSSLTPEYNMLDEGSVLPGFGAVTLEADWVEYDQSRQLFKLDGNASLIEKNVRISADRLYYDDEQSRIDLYNGLTIHQPSLRLSGSNGWFDLESSNGRLTDIEYRLAQMPARGKAKSFEQSSDTLFVFEDVDFTTCKPDQTDWLLRAERITIDRKSGWGESWDSTLVLGGVPVLYTPYLTFPIDDRRKTGLLIPTWGTSNDRGIEVSLPYYINLAPNYDATITPHWMSNRGLQLGGELRYMDSWQDGEIYGEYLNDRVSSENRNNVRTALRVEHNSEPLPGLTSRIDYNRVSDEEYLEDFGSSFNSRSQRYLSQSGEVKYELSGWRLSAKLQDFQTVDSALAKDDEPYAELPKLSAYYDGNMLGSSLQTEILGEFTAFDHETKVNGQRRRLSGSFSLPAYRSWGFAIPKLSLHHINYHLDEHKVVETGPSTNLPALSLDTGLNYEGHSFGVKQTLEPRLFFLYIPYEEQDDLPNFDTIEPELTFDQLFRENRFIGGDRIGDTQQISLGFTSRWYDPSTGLQRYRLRVGQSYYLTDRRVQLDGETQTDHQSPIIIDGNATISRRWQGRFDLSYDPWSDDQRVEHGRIGFQYKTENDDVLNLSYQYNWRHDIKDIDLSFYWQARPDINLLGAWQRSLYHQRDINRLLGIEYGGRCCWSLRLVYQQYVNETDENDVLDQPLDTRIMLQFGLRGLGSFGTESRHLIRDNIEGYEE